MSFWCGFVIVPWYRWLPHLCDGPSVWRLRLCDGPICVTTHLCDDPICVTIYLCDNPVYVSTRLCDDSSVWRPRLCDDLVMWPWVRFLDLKWYWIFYGSQWIICSFIVTLGSLVLQYGYHSCHDVKEIYFAEFKWKSPKLLHVFKLLIFMNLHFLHPH